MSPFISSIVTHSLILCHPLIYSQQAVVGTLEDDILVVIQQNRTLKKQVENYEAEKKAKAEASSSSWVPSVPSLF